ncbi:glycosyltransferase family 39 protein [Hoeflea sp. CAU 1731]
MRLDRSWPIIIIGYFAAQVLLRTLIGGALGLDEAQAILDSREYAWGYGPQPPLFNWLQHTVFLVIGESVFSLSLLKNALLCLTYLSLYALLRTTFDRTQAGLATISLLLLPQIAWESQRALTHSVMATTSVMVTALIFWFLNERRSLLWYVLFGLAVGLGCLSKFNYVMIPVALLFAGLSLPEMRATVANWRLAVSGLVAALVLLKPAAWMLANRDLALSSTRKFDIEQDHGVLSTALSGVSEYFLATALFLILALVVLGLLRLRYGVRPEGDAAEPTLLLKLLVRMVIIAAALTLALVLFSGVTNVKDRWLQPVLVLAAPALVLWTLPRLKALGHIRLAQIVAVLALVVLVALPVNMLYGTPRKPSYSAAPIAALTERIAEEYPQARFVYSYNGWLAGNIAYEQPGWTVLTPDRIPRGFELPDEFVLVWSPENSPFAGATARAFNEQFKDVYAPGDKTSFSAAYRFRGDARPFTAAFVRAGMSNQQ